jgi:predicted RecB family nuclease
MPTRITRDIIESYLNCKYKGHLKLAEQQGVKSDYDVLLVESRDEVRRRAIDKIVARHPAEEVEQDLALTPAALKRGAAFLLNATLEDEHFSLAFDCLQRVLGPSKLGDFHYVPVLIFEGRQLRKQQRAMLDVYGFLISRLQGRAPASGIIWHGKECRATRVRLNPDPRKAERLLEELSQMQSAEAPLRLVLNDHCAVCEFRQRCHQQAVQEDNISLLRGMKEKEVKAYARKGILTLTQLAHTFRPRRKGKRAVRTTHHRYHALQALAIRDKRIYVFGAPELPDSPVKVFLDIEGVPDAGFIYLIGISVVEGEVEKRFSFWADDKEQEQSIFEQFLAEVGPYDDFRVFCYGSYERTFLKRMRNAAKRKGPVDQVLKSLVNVLSLVYVHLYFPTYSNGLKDVAGCLGSSWSESDASGLQSLVWRAKWEDTRDEAWKEKLLAYNREDCAALKRVSELVYTAGSRPGTADGGRLRVEGQPPLALVEELDKLGAIVHRGKIAFFHPDFEYINNCGHFDYQRQRVYVRTGRMRKKRPKRARVWRNRKVRVNRKVHIVSKTCPSCGNADVIQWEHGSRAIGCSTKHKRAFDLVFTAAGVKRRVIECTTSIHQCSKCGEVFVPERYQRLAKHFHGLMSWAMYEYVAHRIGCPMLKEMLRDYFGLAVCQQELTRFKPMMARYYRPCYKRLLDKILSGKVLHIDETEVNLRTGKQYVWVLATSEAVVYLYRPTREGSFLPDLLKDFKGVLVSDFYAAYDAIDCPQQKCLIHLMRDMNQELLNSPFDQELQSITGPFGVLLRAIVETIDRHGLNCRQLGRHQQDVDRYFESLATHTFRSEAAESLRGRLLKYREKLFTFLAHDGVPWNNNLAENAIRQFAYYREDNPGRLGEAGLKDYLVLLSIYQTCRYKEVSFLKFLLSRERDIDAFCHGPRRRRRSSIIEVYPKGVDRPDFGPTRADVAKEEVRQLQGEWYLVEKIAPTGAVVKYDDNSSLPVGMHTFSLIFKDDAVTADTNWPDLPDSLRGRFRLDPRRLPKLIDIFLLDTSSPQPERMKRTTQGIYELEGDRLRLCVVGDHGKKRPSDFESSKGNWLYTLQRNKR